MAWVTLAQTHILARMTENERANYEKSGDPTAAIDRLPEIISQVTSEIRARVQSCPKNKVIGAAGTIPEECLSAACVLCKLYLIASVPAMEEFFEKVREKELEMANNFLDKVSACEISIVPASSPSGESSTSAYGGDCIIKF